MGARRFGWVIAALVAMHAGDVAAQAKPVFPEELRGQWDSAALACEADVPSDSDMRMEMGLDYRNHDEDRSELVSISRIADSPKTWLVRLKSGLLEGTDALFDEILVSRGDSLVITNGDYGHAYDRCK